jgi:MFS family permease
VLHFANMLMIVAALVLAADSIYTASLLGNLGHALFMILMPKSLSDQYPDSVTRKTMLNDFTIYRDIAAAIGALLAGLLLTMHWVHEFYFGIGFLLLLFIPYKMLIKSRKVEK